MAFFVHDGRLCRDMWPNDLARFPSNLDDVSTLPESRLLPTSYDELCSRVVVSGGRFNTENSPQVLAILPELESEDESASVLCIRLQGIVKEASLMPRGNWTGEPDDAVKALQSLTLVDLYPGNADSAFARQREGIKNLEELILCQTFGREGDEKPALVARNGAINLRKRAFAMPKPDVVGINLTIAEDPDGEIRDLEPEWVVDHRIGTFVPNAKGRICSLSPQAIRAGDMVDVAVSVDVVRRRGWRGDFMVEAMFCPRDVVKLKSAEEVRAVMAIVDVNPVSSPASTDPRPPPTIDV